MTKPNIGKSPKGDQLKQNPSNISINRDLETSKNIDMLKELSQNVDQNELFENPDLQLNKSQFSSSNNQML